MNQHGGLVMNFPVAELKDRLVRNRKNHEKIAKEAREGYLTALQVEFEEKVEKLKKGEKVKPSSDLQVPGDNLDQYDTAIEMLNFTSDEIVELSQDQFHAYVLDKWRWQKSFLEVASAYSSGGHYYLTSNSW